MVLCFVMKTDFPVSKDTNSVVENWFKYVKRNILGTIRDHRPYVCEINLNVAINARIRLESLYGAQKKKSCLIQKQRKDEELFQEIWKMEKRT